MAKIQPLDNQVVKQLKASITIISLEQCLEELVKNALDAGATSIDVKVDIDQCTIQVADNGVGILSSELPQIAQRHVTSKCHTLADLNGTKTFGYRGEALASLAAMSILHITTRHESSADTYKAVWKDTRLIQLSKSTDIHNTGTIVLIPSLFYKLPVRQKNQTTTMDTVKYTLMLFALIFPQVNFTLVDKKRGVECMVTKKYSSSFGIFQSLFDQRIAQSIKAFSIQENRVRLQGYIGGGVPIKAHQYIYVNRHYVPPSTCDLYKTVLSTIKKYSSERSADEQTRKEKGYPLFLIKIECACLTSYDIPYLVGHTIYPRLTILLQRLILQYIRSVGKFEPLQEPPKKKQHTSTSTRSSRTSNISIGYPRLSRSLQSSPQKLNAPLYQKINFDVYPDPPLTTNTIDRSRLRQNHDPVLDSIATLYTPSQQSSSAIKSIPTPSSQTTSYSSGSKHKYTTATSSVLSLETSSSSSYCLQAPKKLQRQDLDSAKVIAQVDRKWIMCLLDGTLLLIDQHAADERVKLENMLDKDLDVRFLQPYLVITITEQDLELAIKYRLALQHWGIYVERNGHGTIPGGSPHFTHRYQSSPHFTACTKTTNQYQLVVTRLPYLILDRCVHSPPLLSDLIHTYLNGLEGRTLTSSICPPVMMDMLKSKACRGAIMFNDPLTMEQCTGLVKSLAKCRFPFQCAHGRPSVVPLMAMDNQSRLHSSRPIRWDKFLK